MADRIVIFLNDISIDEVFFCLVIFFKEYWDSYFYPVKSKVKILNLVDYDAI